MDGGRMEWLPGYGAGAEQADLQQRVARLAATVDDLRAKVELDGEEIDALQAATRTRQRWWREPSLVVSVLAVVLAGVATYLTQAGSAAESENAKRQQLASNVQRINSLERESADLAQRSPELAAAAEWYRRATNIHTESARYGVQFSEPQRLLTDFATEIFWHAIDAQLGDCGQRKQHLRLARSALERVPNFEAYTLNVTMLRNAETATTTACGA